MWVPVIAAELLEPRQLRAWAALAYADAVGKQVSQAELGEILVHHSGKRTGQPIGAGAAAAVVDGLEAQGWVRVHRRAGWQGRHSYEVLEAPTVARAALLAPEKPDDATPKGEFDGSGVSDGSGSGTDDGSLTNEEDLQIDRFVNEGRLVVPAVGGAEVTTREAPVDNSPDSASGDAGPPSLALRAVSKTRSPLGRSPQAKPAYSGPRLTFSPQMAWITEPVRLLLAQARPYVQREFARLLSAEMALGTEPERLRSRLTGRFATTLPVDIRNVEGWLLKVAAIRWGCHDPRCEGGIRWHTGEQCGECREERRHRRAQRLHESGHDTSSQGDPEQDPPYPASLPPIAKPPVALRPSVPPSSAGLESDVPSRCPDCRSWAPGRCPDGRCGRCAVRHTLAQTEIAAMDAAGRGLSGTHKLAAARRASDDVRRRVAAAREAATTAGIDQAGQEAAALAAAKDAAVGWINGSAVLL